jgi:hypothetical protein
LLDLEKAAELKQEIAILSQTFERVVDRKDAILKSLALDLEEAEIQVSCNEVRISSSSCMS